MHFTLFSTIFSLFVLTTFVYSAPTASLDSTAATLLNNALEAQRLNAQFANSNATGPCTDGDTTCIQGAFASCVNGQFDTSQVSCPGTQQCFALPSVTSSGTVIACTSEKNALSIIEAAGATGGITGSGSGDSTSSASTSSTLSASTTTSTDPSTTTSASLNNAIVTVTETIIASGSTTLPLAAVTQTLTPDEANSLLSSLLAQDDPATTPTPSPSSTVTATVTATITESDVLSSTVTTSTTNTPSSTSSATPGAIDNTAGSPTSLGSANGGYSS